MVDTQGELILILDFGSQYAQLIARRVRENGVYSILARPNLPAEVVTVTYDLEYGTDTLEMHKDAVRRGDRVLIVDDLLATGGTAAAAARMVEDAGGVVVGLGFVVELTFLAGRRRLSGHDVFSLLEYDK